MRKFKFLLPLLLVATGTWAQTRQLTGNIKDSKSGSSLPSVTVKVKGKRISTSTDAGGSFTLNAPTGPVSLELSSIGYVTKTVDVGSTESTVSITLDQTAAQLGEVVVTALGISKESRKLGYAVSTVNGDQLNRARETNVALSLEGQVAGLLGLPFAFAHHFSAANTLPALALYRQHFRPSEVLDRPYAMVAAAVVCAETDERARFLAGSGALSFLRLRSGRPGPLPSPEEAAAYPYSEMERAFVEDRLATQIVGAPETVQRGIADLVDATQADELMITTMVYDPADRLGSFERVAALARASSGAPASR